MLFSEIIRQRINDLRVTAALFKNNVIIIYYFINGGYFRRLFCDGFSDGLSDEC